VGKPIILAPRPKTKGSRVVDLSLVKTQEGTWTARCQECSWSTTAANEPEVEEAAKAHCRSTPAAHNAFSVSDPDSHTWVTALC
jgi:hypothetical protein